MRLWALIGLAALSAPVHAQELTRAERRAGQLPVEEVADRLEIRGEGELDPELWISTRPFLGRKIGTDHFFRARIDKASGEIAYQLYVIIEGREALWPERVTYDVGAGLVSQSADRIDFDVSCYRSSCTVIEHAASQIPASDMAAMGKCGEGRAVRFKLFGAAVDGPDLASPCNEIAGLILAVEKATK